MSSLAERIKYFRKVKGLSQLDLSKETEISRTYISTIEAGRQEPSFAFIKTLSTTYGMSIDWLLTGHGQMFLSETENNTEIETPVRQSYGLFMTGDQIFIPLSGIDACCGNGIMTYPQDYDLDETVRVKKSSVGVLEEGRLPFAVETHGRSMEGFGIPEGSTVIVNPAEDIQSGDIVLVIISEKAAIKKYLERPDGEDFLSSTGDRIHATAEEIEEGYYVKKIGKVMLVIAPPEHGV